MTFIITLLWYLMFNIVIFWASLIAQFVKKPRAMSGRSPEEGIGYPLQCYWASLVAQLVKNPPAMQETWVWSLGWEDPLEKGMATHSSILAWRIPWTEEPGRLQSMGSQRVGYDWATNISHFWARHGTGHFTSVISLDSHKPCQGPPLVPCVAQETNSGSWGHLPKISQLVWSRAGAPAQCCPNNRLHWHFKVISDTFYSSMKL